MRTNGIRTSLVSLVVLTRGVIAFAGDLTDSFVEEARRLYRTDGWVSYTNSLTGKGPYRRTNDSPRADVGSGLVRWVDVDGICNVRDIGGWTGLKTGLVYRGSEPNCHTNAAYLAKRKKKCHNLTATTKGLMVLSKEMGIKTDLDLRGERESPTPNETPIPGARLVRIPCGNYTNFLLNTEVAAKLLRVFANRDSYPIYFHCYGGADRTGSLAFLLEGLCGVTEVDLAIDYELTSFSRMGRRPRFDKPYYYASMVAAMKRRPGMTLQEKIEHYVMNECGLSAVEVAAIRSILCGDMGAKTSVPLGPPIRTDAMRNATSLNPGLRRIGTLRHRSAKEIGAANWTIDAGPVDRDFVDFDKYRDYLPGLGVAKIRLMTGWAKSERKKGTMDVAWLDRIVDWCKAHGIEPILELSYGNPIYKGAGGAGLRDGIPNTPEGLAAWDRWVDFLGGHFKGRVREWAMWNEPDINPEANPPEAVAAFNVRSAKILRRHMPDCRLHGLSLAHNDPEFLARCIRPMGEDVRLFDTFVYHGYVRNPDFSYANVEKQKAVLARLAPHAVLRQGENGCASEWLDRFSLRYAPWSEVSQSKWNLRRMLGDLGHGVESGLFCFTDINYQPPTFPVFFCNRKGYLRLNASNDVIRIKRTYYAVQNAVSVFDASVALAERPLAVCRDRTISLYEYRTKGGASLLVFWQHGPVHVEDNGKATFLGAGDLAAALDENAAPGESFETRGIAIQWGGRKFEDPVWVDLMTGWVYELPEDRQIVHSCGIDIVEVPSYDSPCILTERMAVDYDAFLARCDRPTARYRCGETATFSVESSLSEGVAHVRLDNFGDRVLREFDVDLAAKRSFEVKGTRDVPGFLRLTVTCGRHAALWGAAFSPEKISAGVEKPTDFDAFWRNAIADYDAKVPEDVRLERVEALSTNEFDIFEVSLSSPCGKRLFGLLSEPKNLSDGPFPVMVTVPGAGPSDGVPLCVKNHIGLKMNVHRYRPSPGATKNAEVHVALQRVEDGELAAQYPAKERHYYLSGIAAGPEEYFYYDVILGARRAVRWLRRRAETRDDDFIYQGGSQGAGVGLALVALDGGFRRALFAVPALTAHLCHKIDGRMAGWPRLVSSQLDVNVAASERNSLYFDGVNFASMIHCPVRFVVGYVDVVAPPHAGYAAYNACPSTEKMMVDGVGLGHATSAAVRAANMRWLITTEEASTVDDKVSR